MAGRVQQHVTRRGQLQAFAAALKQWRAHDLLQPPDLLAQRGLGDEDPLRGMGEAACLSQGHEIPQMPQFEA